MAEAAKSVVLYQVEGSKGTWRFLCSSPAKPGQVLMECVETGMERWLRAWDVQPIEEG